MSGSGFLASGDTEVGIELCLNAGQGNCDQNTICATFNATSGSFSNKACKLTSDSPSGANASDIYVQNCPNSSCNGTYAKCVGTSPADPADNCQLGASNFATPTHLPAAYEDIYTQLDTDDHFAPVSTSVKATTTSVTLSLSSFATVTCKNSATTGKTPAAGLEPFATSPLTLNNGGSPTQPCTDSKSGRDTFTANTTNGTWKISFLDAALDETSAEPNSGDRPSLAVPSKGLVDKLRLPSGTVCTITAAPSALFQVVGAYNDHSTFTISITNLPVSVTGVSPCPTATHDATFKASYTFSPGFSDAS